MGNRGESPPPDFKRGLAPDRIFHLGGRARRHASKLLAVLCPRFCEGPGSPSGRRRRRIERFPGTLFFHGGC